MRCKWFSFSKGIHDIVLFRLMVCPNLVLLYFMPGISRQLEAPLVRFLQQLQC